jgi:hypothetical protein
MEIVGLILVLPEVQLSPQLAAEAVVAILHLRNPDYPGVLAGVVMLR